LSILAGWKVCKNKYVEHNEICSLIWWYSLNLWYLWIVLFLGCLAILSIMMVKAIWNAMTHAQKPDFVFLRNGRVHLNQRGASVQSTTGSRGVRISCSNAGYNMFRGSVKCTGYPLYKPVSPSLPRPCFTVCHYISTGVYVVTYITHAYNSIWQEPSRYKI